MFTGPMEDRRAIRELHESYGDGVVRFDNAAQKVLSDVMDSGLEHHMALAYGDHRKALRGIAAGMGLNVIELGAA